ncbi:HPr family phosphocarrier protein [Bacteroides heparinolyticus]|uniref:HPr family phosphocarrier protein n=1 Tax=Prevotella heparinolytica TaxID=28113 RepID=UPI0035A0A158
MKEVKIKLSSVQDAKDFVNLAGKCDFDIDLYNRHMMIDAKSLIGVLSVDLKNVLTVKFDGEDAGFEAFLEAHKAVAESAA